MKKPYSHSVLTEEATETSCSVLNREFLPVLYVGARSVVVVLVVNLCRSDTDEKKLFPH